MYERDRSETEFIGVAAHEIRTPVTSLLLSVQLLEEEAVGVLTQAQQEIVAAQRQDLERLERLMMHLLDVARLEAGALPPRLKVISAHNLVQEAIDSVWTHAESKQIVLRSAFSETLPFVRADREQMTRVFTNLLNNAIRHTPIGGFITVALNSDGKLVEFHVADTGTGIPTEYVPHIFERFVQVPGATRGSSGLGLSIAQTIVTAHSGTIRVDSEPDHGSCFTVTLPAVLEKEVIS